MSKPNSGKTISFYKLFKDIFPVIAKSAPIYFTLWVTAAFLMSVAMVLRTILLKNFFDDAQMLYDGMVTLYAPIISLSLLFLCCLFEHLTNWATNFLSSCMMMMKVEEKTSVEMFGKLARLAPIEFENTERLDDINKANEGRYAALWFVSTIVMLFFFYLPYFIFMSVFLYSLKPIFILAVVAAFVPAMLSQYVNVKVFSKAEDESAPVRRMSNHYEDCLVSREYFKETRLLGAYDFFLKLYQDSIFRLNQIVFKATIKSNLIILCLNITTCVGIIGVLYLLVSSLMNGEITAGAFAAVFTSISTLFTIMNGIIDQLLKNITRSVGKIKNYISLMDIEEHSGHKKAPTGSIGIELQKVSFRYPNAEKNALSDIDLVIKAGETVAVVGENGSGKSTLIRLITGLYMPETGAVLHNNINTGDILSTELFKNTSAVFQKYTRYQMTLAKNITISDLQKEYKEKNLDTAMEHADISKNDAHFPDGYETMLSREFEGVDLSGGEWQRVAIARAFYKEHGLVVLDEPTAAIDPLEETKIYNRFAELSKGKTAIIVTHRLGSVKLANRILVMKESRLIESGTHEELMNGETEYKKMFLSQQKQYV